MAVIDRDLLSSAIPHIDENFNTDESFIGYLLRLKEVNHYETLSWILQLAEIKDYAHSGFSFALKGSLDVSPLARLTGVEESALASMLYVPLRIPKKRMMGDYSVFGSSVPSYLIQIRKPKICPLCLLEANYARKIWELAPVTTCPLHQCQLLDQCPSCEQRIIWNRGGVSLCRCEFDWRKHNVNVLDDSELKVTRQIHLLCNLPTGPHVIDKSRSNNPLYALGLQQFLSALIFVASQFAGDAQRKGRKGQRTIDTKGKHFAPSRRNAEIHTLLSKALRVFDDWPNNYYSFLDWRRSQKGMSEYARARANYFAGYKSALYIQLASVDFDFMRNEFREYRRIRRYESYMGDSGGIVDPSSKRENDVPPQSVRGITAPGRTEVNISNLYETHVPGYKAKKALKTSWKGLEGLITSGKLKAVIGRRGEGRLFFVEKASLEELREKLERSLFLKQTERAVGVHFGRIKELIGCGLLRPIRGPEIDGYGEWKFDRKEVFDLVEHLVSKLPRKRKADNKKVIGFKLVLRKISHARISLGTFLQAVLDREIKPCGKNTEAGLRGLLFWEKQITNYVKSELRLLIGGALSLPEVTKLLGVNQIAMSYLVRKGFIHGEKFAAAPSLGLFVKREEVDSFMEEYLPAKEIASKHGTTPRYIVCLLGKQGIQPASGPDIDGGHTYLIRKNEIEALDLPALILEEKKHVHARRALCLDAITGSKGPKKTANPKKPPQKLLDEKFLNSFQMACPVSPEALEFNDLETPVDIGVVPKASKSHCRTLKASPWGILDEIQTAEALELDVETVCQLTERGVLKPHKRLSCGNSEGRKYYFSTYTVQKYKNRSIDHTGLIAYRAAAKLFDLWPNNFHNRFVKTGRLTPVVAEGRRSDYFFRLDDVTALLEIEKQTIITPKAADILEVYVSCIDKLIAGGILKPISGPAVDGFGKNLFLRSDVEKLRAERDSYKAKRIKEGKTSRFGRGESREIRPVRDVIGPRIDKLIEKWLKETPSQYISGYRLHKQLTREGYQVGIVTVYVHLRQRHQAA